MPQVLKGIALLVSTITAAYASATLVTKALIQIGTTIALTKISTMLGPKAPRVRDFPQDVEYSDTMASRRILYGENKVSGMNVIPPLVTGTEGAFLHQVLALAGHEVNAIGDVFFNKEQLTLDGSGNVTGGTFGGKGSVRKYLGTSTQTADSILSGALSEWTSDHRGRGIAYLAIRYQYDTEVYRSGKPDVTCIVQGKKVYDPRLDTSPGANPTDATYAAYSTNPALCLADYLIASYGLSESAARVDWSLVVAAANICDEDVNIPGSATQKRFTCNLVLDAVSAFETNIEALALAMMGTCYYSGGKWRMYAGAWSSSAFTLTADNVIGELSIQTAASRKSDGYYNAVRGRFIDKDRDYQPLEFEPILNSTYESEDGERIYTEVDFPACNNQYEAQRNAIILSKQSRRQKTVTVVCDFSAYKIRPWETGTATIAEVGWSSQPVRCVGWKFRPEPAVELTLQEVASTDYDDPNPLDYVTPASVSVTNPAAYKPGSPQSFTATQEIESILLQWQAPTNTIAGILYQVFEHSAATPFSSAVKIYEGADTQLRVPRTDTNTRYFWVRSFYRPSNGFSNETPSGNGLSSSGRAATISGYLTNEAITLEADSAGTISDYSKAVGFFKVFSGTTDVTSSATFAEVSETNVTGDINTADDTPIAGQVKGYYRVTALSGGDTGTYTISATYGGATITKDFTVTKVQDGQAGATANIYLTQTGIAIPADNDGANPVFTNASTTVTVYEGQTDESANWSVTASPSTGITGTLSTRTYTLTGMTVDTGYVEFTATRSGYDPLVIRLSVTKVRAGATGATGPAGDVGGISPILDPEFAAVMAYSDGTVISFDPAQGQFSIFLGEEDLTGSATLSSLATDCTGTVNTAADTPVSGKPKGYYRITAMTADTAKLTITASLATDLGDILMEDGFAILQEDGSFLTQEGFFSVSKTFNVAKSKVGYEIVSSLPSTNLFEGRIVFLTTDDKLYRYDGSQWITAVPATDITGEILANQIANEAISTAKFAQGIRPVEIVNSLPAAGTQGRVVFLTTDNKLYRDDGTNWTAAVPTTDLSGTIVEAQIAAEAINTAKFAQGIRPVEIVSTLPAAGTAGRVVFLTTDNKLYRDTGSTWTAAVPTTDLTGTVTGSQIADEAINTAKFAQGLRPVEVVNFLPAAGTQGRTVFLTSDNKLYRDNGTSWVATVPANDITGQLADAQVAALAASKITGQLSDTQLAAIAAAKITGQLSDSQLAAIAAAKITGEITETQIANDAITTPKIAAGAVTASEIAALTITANELAADSITTAKIAAGAVTANEIAALTITANELAADSITTAKIAAGAVTANEIAANTITANEIASNTITANEIAGNTITANEIAGNTITAGQIAAGAISTDELAADAVTTEKLAAGAITANEIAANTITANQIAANTITANEIAGNTITANEIAANTITAGEIAAGAINTDELAANAVTTGKLAAGAVTANEIAANTITAGQIASNTITANEIAANTITANEIASNTITAGQIASGAINTDELAANAVTTGKLAAGAVTANEIAANTITAGQIATGAITADELATDAVTSNKIFAGAVTAAKIDVTNLAAISADMGSITAGNIVLPSGGFIRSGQTAFDTGTGFYLGNDSGTPKFSIGNAAGKNIKWDGSDFTINGGVVTTGSIALSAVTNSNTAQDSPTGASPSNLTASHTSIGNPVFLVARLDNCVVTSTTSSTITYTIALLRGGTTLVSKTYITSGEPLGGGQYLHTLDQPDAITYIDIGLAAGSYTYAVQVSHNGSGGTTDWADRTLFVQESKR